MSRYAPSRPDHYNVPVRTIKTRPLKTSVDTSVVPFVPSSADVMTFHVTVGLGIPEAAQSRANRLTFGDLHGIGRGEDKTWNFRWKDNISTQLYIPWFEIPTVCRNRWHHQWGKWVGRTPIYVQTPFEISANPLKSFIYMGVPCMYTVKAEKPQPIHYLII